jgi:general secretion pathway protein D
MNSINRNRRPRCGKMLCRITASLLALLMLPISTQAEGAAALYKKGVDLEARQDYEAAYSAYQEAWRQKPKDIKYRTAAMRMRFLAGAAHVHRGQQLRDAGKLEEALTEFQKAASIDPGSFIASQEAQRTQTLIESAKSAKATTSTTPQSFIQRKLDKAAKAAAEPVELAPMSNQPITLKMTEDSKLIFETLGNLAGINVLFDPDYTSRKVHIELNGVTLPQALRMIAMASKAFWRVVTPNTIFVASDTAGKRKDLQESIIKTFYLTNLSETAELQSVVTALHSLLELSHVTPVPELGAIIVRATPDQIALASKIINDLDKGRAEVVVDVAVMQVTRDKIRDIGTNLPTSVTVYPSSNVVATTTTNSSSSTTSTGQPAGTINFGHVDGTSFAVNIPSATANFLFSDSNTKIIQNPQIRAADGQKATLKIGDRVPVATGSFQAGIGASGVSPLVNTQFQYLDVGVNIDITPYIHGDRSVTLKVSMDISSVTGSVNIGGLSQPTIGQRRIEHEIRLKEGEVNLLGGILEDSDIKSMSGYPGLSNLPVLKYLFSDQHAEKHQNEIVFLMTPHIVRAQEVSPENLRPLDVGTESTIELEDADLVPSGTLARPAASASSAASAASTTARQTQPLTVPVVAAATVAKPSVLSGPLARQTQVAVASAATQLSAAPVSVLLSFNPPKQSVTVGHTFTVDVMVSNAQNLSSVPIQLQYDSAKLQITNVSNGGFLAQGEQVVALAQRDDPATGTVRITAIRPPNAGGASGSGALLSVTFLAKSVGKATVSIARAGLRSADEKPVAASGTPAFIEIKQALATQANVGQKQ